jgi:hypothetical protein
VYIYGAAASGIFKRCIFKLNTTAGVSAIIKNISLSIFNVRHVFFATSKITEFKIIHKKKIIK